MKYNTIIKEKYLREEQLKPENKDFIVIDSLREFTPIPQCNMVYEMPAE